MTAADEPPATKVSHRSTELDFVRGVAILLVLLVHTARPDAGGHLQGIERVLEMIGLSGVNLFFSLSGFLVGGLLVREYIGTGRIHGGRFLLRRAMKIWPPLYALLLFHLITGRHPASTFLWQNILQIQNYVGTSIAQTWSLAVEEHFYIGLALLLSLIARGHVRFGAIIAILGAISAASASARIEAVSHGMLQEAVFQTQYRLDSLLPGVMLGVVYWMRPTLYAAIARQRLVLALGVAALIASVGFAAHHPVYGHGIGLSVESIGGCALIVLVHQHSGALARTAWFKGVAWLGIYSYGIYLWHSLSHPLAAAGNTALARFGIDPDLRWIVTTGMAMAFSVLVGAVMSRLVEWPALRLRDRMTRGPAAKAPVLTDTRAAQTR